MAGVNPLKLNAADEEDSKVEQTAAQEELDIPARAVVPEDSMESIILAGGSYMSKLHSIIANTNSGEM